MANETDIQLIKKYELEKYLQVPNTLVGDRRSETDGRLEQLIVSASMGIERKGKEFLQEKRAKLNYPLIDPSFLSISQSEERQFTRGNGEKPLDLKMELPIFAVYPLTESSLRIDVEVGHSYADCGLIGPDVKMTPGLPDVLGSQLQRAVTFNRYARSCCDSAYSNKYYGSFETSFVGLIPPEVKQEIENARGLFDLEQIYIVVEAVWNPVKVVPTRDPLVLGLKNEKCFLISQFYTTPLEECVLGIRKGKKC